MKCKRERPPLSVAAQADRTRELAYREGPRRPLTWVHHFRPVLPWWAGLRRGLGVTQVWKTSNEPRGVQSSGSPPDAPPAPGPPPRQVRTRGWEALGVAVSRTTAISPLTRLILDTLSGGGLRDQEEALSTTDGHCFWETFRSSMRTQSQFDRKQRLQSGAYGSDSAHGWFLKIHSLF